MDCCKVRAFFLYWVQQKRLLKIIVRVTINLHKLLWTPCPQ